MKKTNSMSYWIRYLLIVPLAALFMLPTLPIFPCSSFFIKNGEQMLFGKNYDWHLEFGYVMINKRGVVKTALKYVDLRNLDFSCRTPVKVLDLNGYATGNVNNIFGDYSGEMNYEMIKKALLQTSLHASDSEESIRFRARYPESTQCLN